MWIVKIYKNGEWQSWGSAASPRVINKYLELLKVLQPQLPVMLERV